LNVRGDSVLINDSNYIITNYIITSIMTVAQWSSPGKKSPSKSRNHTQVTAAKKVELFCWWLVFGNWGWLFKATDRTFEKTYIFYFGKYNSGGDSPTALCKIVDNRQ